MTRDLRGLAIGLALMVAAGVVVAAEPVEEVRQAPLEVAVKLGERGVGRNVDVTFTDVRLADTVTTEDSYTPWTGTTEGTWVVVDLVASTVIEPQGIQSWLLIDDLLIDGSSRADLGGLENGVLSPGLHTSGSILFEIPNDVLDAKSARVVVGVSSDWRLDSAIALTFDLSALSNEGDVSIARPTLEAQ